MRLTAADCVQLLASATFSSYTLRHTYTLTHSDGQTEARARARAPRRRQRKRATVPKIGATFRNSFQTFFYYFILFFERIILRSFQTLSFESPQSILRDPLETKQISFHSAVACVKIRYNRMTCSVQFNTKATLTWTTLSRIKPKNLKEKSKIISNQLWQMMKYK